MNELELTQMVEQFSRKDELGDTDIKIIRVPDYKTIYIEQIGEVGRSVILSEFKVDGKIYWAGYSSRSNTVFISQGSKG